MIKFTSYVQNIFKVLAMKTKNKELCKQLSLSFICWILPKLNYYVKFLKLRLTYKI